MINDFNTHIFCCYYNRREHESPGICHPCAIIRRGESKLQTTTIMNYSETSINKMHCMRAHQQINAPYAHASTNKCTICARINEQMHHMRAHQRTNAPYARASTNKCTICARINEQMHHMRAHQNYL